MSRQKYYIERNKRIRKKYKEMIESAEYPVKEIINQLAREFCLTHWSVKRIIYKT